MLRHPMSDAPYERIKQLMLAARERPPSERAAFLATECGGDDALRREVESLLEHVTGAPGVLASGSGSGAGATGTGSSETKPDPRAGEAGTGEGGADPGRIGPYRLVRLLGEGGMGQVFLAEQTAPIRREVAIKLIRRGLDTDRVVARFESERQALAMMDHPGIARVFDAGADRDGRPYFVMERVHGEPITTYCERHPLPLRERLELLLRVCAAVQHAHQRGVIHRDLKPSNVLVAEQDGRPAPKVIDFGIAKAIETAPGAETLTVQGQMVGTPEYMSPEQAGVVPGGVDTRTDVYSLGVILYELLTGSVPHPLDAARPSDFLRRIADAEPPRPSAAVPGAGRGPAADATRGRGRGAATQTRRGLAGDLDMIALTALRKEPARRYASVEAFAADIGRHLEGRPIAARPDTWTYRSATFVRRHRAPVVATAAGLVVLGVLGASYAVRLRAERDRANAAREEAEAVTAFLAGMLESPDPAMQGRDVTVRSVLERAAGQIEGEMRSRPRLAARLDEAIGRAYYGLGDLARSEHHLRRSLATRERLLGPGAPATLDVRGALWGTLTDADRYAEAESLARVNLAESRRSGRDEDGESLRALNAVANLAHYQGREAEAESLYRAVLDRYRRFAPDDSSGHSNTSTLLANLLSDQARYAEAESIYVLEVAVHHRLYGADHPLALGIANNLALIRMQTGHFERAESLLVQVVRSRSRLQGPRHPDTIDSKHNLGVVYEQMGRYAEAETLLVEVLDEQRRITGDRGAGTLIVMNQLARVFANHGQLARAETLMRETLAGRRATLGPEHVGTLGTQVWLAIVLGRRDKTAEAEALFARTLEVQRRVLGPRHTNTLNTAFMAGELELDAGRPARAAPLLEAAAAGVGEAFGEDHPDWVRYATRWGECLTRLGRFAEADTLLRRAWSRWEVVQPSLVASPAATARALADLHEAWGRPADAAAWRARAASAPAGPLTAAR
jgi:serine/threonine protein kinase/tetratricopeptide (TPR) repeat protein